jgi:hypothetical protein
LTGFWKTFNFSPTSPRIFKNVRTEATRGTILTLKTFRNMKTEFFAMSDDDFKHIAILGISKPENFESAIMDAAREFYCADDASLKESLNINNFIGCERKEIAVTLHFEGEEDQEYIFNLESTLVYTGED